MKKLGENRNCKFCQKEFYFPRCDLKQKGRGQFCSKACSGEQRMKDRPIEVRFFGFITGTPSKDECWIWGGTLRNGYGQLWFNGESRRSTQVAWEIKHGKPFPEGLMACHTCDNPPCVNPDHIWAGTMKENLQDCVAKGRINPHGRKKTHCKNGHPLSGDNIKIQKSDKKMQRICLMCKRNWWKQKKESLSKGA